MINVFSNSESSLLREVFDVLNCSTILRGFISPSNDDTLLLSMNDDDDEDAPVNLSKSSDDKSRLLAKGTEFVSDPTVDVLMVDMTGGAFGDCDFFERFSKVLTKIWGEKRKIM